MSKSIQSYVSLMLYEIAISILSGTMTAYCNNRVGRFSTAFATKHFFPAKLHYLITLTAPSLSAQGSVAIKG